MTKLPAIALTLLLVTSVSASAQTSTPPPTGTPSAQRTATTTAQSLIDRAATSAETATEVAIAGDSAKAALAITKLKEEVVGLKTDLPPEVNVAVSTEIGKAEANLSKNDLTGSALATAEVYRSLQQSINVKLRTIPLEVALLDYSGFKLQALSQAAATDWSAISAASEEAQTFWAKLAPTVKSKELKDMMMTIESGFKEGVKQKNAMLVSFGSKVLLNAVDLLEGQFKP